MLLLLHLLLYLLLLLSCTSLLLVLVLMLGAVLTFLSSSLSSKPTLPSQPSLKRSASQLSLKSSASQLSLKSSASQLSLKRSASQPSLKSSAITTGGGWWSFVVSLTPNSSSDSSALFSCRHPMPHLHPPTVTHTQGGLPSFESRVAAQQLLLLLLLLLCCRRH
jgi:hypothetical protein